MSRWACVHMSYIYPNYISLLIAHVRPSIHHILAFMHIYQTCLISGLYSPDADPKKTRSTCTCAYVRNMCFFISCLYFISKYSCINKWYYYINTCYDISTSFNLSSRPVCHISTSPMFRSSSRSCRALMERTWCFAWSRRKWEAESRCPKGALETLSSFRTNPTLGILDDIMIYQTNFRWMKIFDPSDPFPFWGEAQKNGFT